MTVRRVGEHSLHIAASMSRLFYSPLSSSPYTSAPQAGVTGGNATRRGEKRAEEASSGTKGTTNERRGWERILLLLVFTVFYELLEDKIRSFKVLMIICFLVSRSAGRSFPCPSTRPTRGRSVASVGVVSRPAFGHFTLFTALRDATLRNRATRVTRRSLSLFAPFLATLVLRPSGPRSLVTKGV